MLGYKLFGSGLSDLTVSAICNDVGTAISAAGSAQSGATALVNTVNGVSTVATGTGVILYAGSGGDCQIVYNGGANAVKVYPPSGARINAMVTNTAHVLATQTACQYWFLSSTQIIGVLSS
jgi:hypothetical protein